MMKLHSFLDMDNIPDIGNIISHSLTCPSDQTTKYRGSPDSTNFVLPGNRTIAKIVLSGN